MRGSQSCERHAARGLGKSGKANTSKSLINAVIVSEPKALMGSPPQRASSREQGLVHALSWTTALPAERRGLPRS